tara:strand:+ start:607 stop:1293 length:687 start_codon:yes stop_codon:yes gene_type:complete
MKAGDGSSLQLPPAFVLVNPRQHRRYKKGNKDQVDGRTQGAKDLMSRINKRKMNKEQVEEKQISEGAPTETERAQKQIAQKKKLNRAKDLQSKKDTAKKSMQRKTAEMDLLMKARLSDFKKKAGSQTTKLKKMNNSIELEGDMIKEGQDVVQVALDVATQELNPSGETNFAKIEFSDKSVQNLDSFSAKRIAAAYAGLEGEQQKQYQYMLNKDASTFQSALDFAIRSV